MTVVTALQVPLAKDERKEHHEANVGIRRHTKPYSYLRLKTARGPFESFHYISVNEDLPSTTPIKPDTYIDVPNCSVEGTFKGSLQLYGWTCYLRVAALLDLALVGRSLIYLSYSDFPV